MSSNADRSTQSSQRKPDSDFDFYDQLQTRPSDSPQSGQDVSGLIARGQFTPSTASYHQTTQTTQPYTRPRNAGQPEKPQSNPVKYPQYVQPPQGQSGQGRPAHSAQRGHSQSSHGQPGYPDLGYGHSSHDQPGYAQPGYGRPSYGQPSYAQPSYGHSGHAQPSGHGQPVYAQPGYGYSSHDQPSYAHSPARDTRK